MWRMNTNVSMIIPFTSTRLSSDSTTRHDAHTEPQGCDGSIKKEFLAITSVTEVYVQSAFTVFWKNELSEKPGISSVSFSASSNSALAFHSVSGVGFISSF